MTDAARGVVYTPAPIAAAMVALALEPLVAGRTIDQIAALRIADFAIGEGAFVVEVVRYLGERIGRDRAMRCVIGVDIDARAVAHARALVPGADLRVANALDFAWPALDLAIGNPPYIRQELLADATKLALRSFASYDGVADLYVYFIELAQRIADRFCVIVPNKWLTAHYARPLRAVLAKAARVEGVLDLGALPVFATADAFPCIVWGSRDAASLVATRVTSGSIEAACAAATPHDRARWTDEPWHIDSDADRALIDRLERDYPALGTLVEKPSRGVVTGYNAAFVVDGATRERLDGGPWIRPLVKGRDLRPNAIAPSDRFILMIERGTRWDDLPRAIRDHLTAHRDALEKRKPGTYRWYELQDPVGPLVKSRAPRLLYQDIQTTPACARDDGSRVPDTTVWILPTADPAILAFLNSRLYFWYAQRRFPPALNGAVRPKLEYMMRLPIVPPDALAPWEAALVEPPPA